MARVKLALPDLLPFATEIPVRITDVNYGGHLGNDSLLSLLHEARVRFLQEHGCTELDAGGCGIIMSDAVVVYKSEAAHGERLRIQVGITDVQRVGCDIVYRVTESETGREVARAKTGIVFYDYEARKVVPAPDGFRQAFGLARP